MAKYYCLIDGQEIGLDVRQVSGRTVVQPLDGADDSNAVDVDFAPVHMNVDSGEGLYSLIAGGLSYQVHIEQTADGLRVVLGRHRYDLDVLSDREYRLRKVAPRQTAGGGQQVIKAPMPGLVKSVSIVVGQKVEAGQLLVVLEAMKMENDIGAPSAGKVSKIHVSPGATVESGKPLVTLE